MAATTQLDGVMVTVARLRVATVATTEPIVLVATRVSLAYVKKVEMVKVPDASVVGGFVIPYTIMEKECARMLDVEMFRLLRIRELKEMLQSGLLAMLALVI